MNLKQFPVSLGGKTFTREQQVRRLRGNQPASELSFAWAKALKAAHEAGEFGVCLCLEAEKNKRRLAIKKSNTGLFHLARYPGTEREHSPYCLYSKADRKRPGVETNEVSPVPDAAAEPVAVDPFSPEAMGQFEAETATVQQYSLVRTGQQDSKRKPKPLPFSSLLPAIWQHSGLTTDNQVNRLARGPLAGKILQTCRELELDGQPLASILLLYSNKTFEERNQVNQRVVDNCIADGSDIWMLSFLSKYNPEKHEKLNFLPISGFHGMPYFTISPDRWKQVLEDHPTAASAWRHGYTVVVFVRAELAGGKSNNPRVRAEIIEATLMVVTDAWVPVFSAAEFALAQRLSNEGRTYTKSLPECAPKGVYAPYTANFYLTDTGGRDAPLVLFDGDASAEVTRERVAYFSNLFPQPGAWWKWSPGESIAAPLPAVSDAN